MKKEQLSKILFYIAVSLLSFIFFNIFISNFLFIFNVNINKFNFIIALIMSICLDIILIKNDKIILKHKISYFFITITFLLIIIFSSIFINGKIYDYTWDGNSYHKFTIGFLAKGWNPLYQDMEEFDKISDHPIYVKSNNTIWGNHYAKASHVFAANIYSFTNNIESGKCINTISIISLFLLIFAYLLQKTKFTFAIILSVILISYPVVGSQYLTNYVDLLLYIYLMMLLFSLWLLETNNIFVSNKENYLIYFMILVLMINIKFTSFAYAGIYCFGYYIYCFFHRKKRLRFFYNFTLVSLVALFTGVFIVGLSVYPKNLIEHGNMFYPLLGKDKVEIMVQNQPDYFKNKSAIEKFTISMFSKVDNISESSGLKATYKIPFSTYNEEFNKLGFCDLRISGNGIFFSGIFIISIIIILFNIKKVYDKDKKLVIISMIFLSITILLIFILNESWWARYFPQIYLFPIISLIFLYKTFDIKITKIIFYIYTLMIVINNFLILYYSTTSIYKFTKDVNIQYYNFEKSNKDCQLLLHTDKFHGALFNVIDKEKNKYDIRIVNKNEYMSNKNNINLFMYIFVSGKCEVENEK